MAQLPPKAPTLANNWTSFPYQMTPSASQPSNGMDEFLDFSSMRRQVHRRSVSDPVTFTEECRDSHKMGFVHLDDEQFSSMFPNHIEMHDTNVTSTRSSSNPSSPSDQNSDNVDHKPTPIKALEHGIQLEQLHHHQQPKNEPGEVEHGNSGQEATEPAKHCSKFSSDGTTIVDPKRMKRILANRQSAQRSRVRKLQYISELERSFTILQTEVLALSPRVAFFDHQRLVLNVDNNTLKQRIAALAQDKIFKDAYQEALKKDMERLRKVYHEQNMQMGSNDEEEENVTVTGGNNGGCAAVNRSCTERCGGVC